ncbi:MAG: imidazolonepropionase [Acidobacteriaceae bacterium]|jgi:imidazolonepropionase|nr:imidazolonepropionase [Acidobacteriaceae bacterium]MDX6459081.1 imidazolonepropionase [Acidobacteriaceae bacterium]
MNADLLITGIAQLATATDARPKFGAQMSEVSVIENAAMAIAGDRFVWTGLAADWQGMASRTIDLGGHAVVPGLVDPHTHAVWAGDRLHDFDARTSGVSYEHILASGGGIWSTIRATMAASDTELVSLAEHRIWALIRSGATLVEVKSGYGFTVAGELRMLEAIHVLASRLPIRIVPTLLVHIPPGDARERETYLDQVRSELIPEAARCRLAQAVDIFVEKEAWSAGDAESVLSCARDHNLRIKMHAEQFHSVGGLELALRLKALSVDHLEACQPHQYGLFRNGPTIATILPGVSLHLGIPKAPGRELIDSGAAVAVGTDLNPGSSPLFSISTALGLAVRLNGLTAREALVAGTLNAGHALGLADAGRIAPGAQADFAVLESRDWRDLVYSMGTNPVREVWCKGSRIVSLDQNTDTKAPEGHEHE